MYVRKCHHNLCRSTPHGLSFSPLRYERMHQIRHEERDITHGRVNECVSKSPRTWLKKGGYMSVRHGHDGVTLQHDGYVGFSDLIFVAA